MTTHLHRLPMLLLAAAVVITLPLTPATLRAAPLSAASIRIEINGTEGDAGVQFFLDGEGWKSCTVSGPDGQRLVTVTATGSARMNGLTELFIESAEPSFEEQPLPDLLRLFPQGNYAFDCVTTDDKTLKRSASLTHKLPATPEGVGFDPGPGKIVWQEVKGPFELDGEVFGDSNVVIVAYEVIVERLGDGLKFSITLPAPATSVTVPVEFIKPNTKYKVEVLAIERGGNQTIAETQFTTQ
jgi:hypothetical protein